MAGLAPSFRPDPPPPQTSPIEATLLAAQREEDKKREDRTPFMDFAKQIPEAKSGPLNFTRFPYQEELYSQEVAEAREVVVMKATQVGVSSMLFRFGLYEAFTRSYTVLYTFPTDDDMYDFSDTRVVPAIMASQFLLDRMPPDSVQNKGLKQVGRGFCYYRGSKSRSGAQSVDADTLIFDEYDELDRVNLPQIERRITGAEAAGRTARVRRVGVPTVPGRGIEAAYRRSDQRVWHVTCRRKKCGYEQPVTFWENMRWRVAGSDKTRRAGDDDAQSEVTEAWRACSKCGTRLDVNKGRWIKQNPESKIPGFHVTRMIVPNTDLADIVKHSRDTSPSEVETFHNNDLGEPFSSTESSLDEATVKNACSLGGERLQAYTGRRPVTMGIDVASSRPLSARVSEQYPDGIRKALWIGEPENFQELVSLMERFNVAMCAIDSNPEYRSAQTLAATFPGRVVLAEYEWNPRAEPIVYDPEKNKIRVQRTLAIDATMDAIRQRRNIPLRQPPPHYIEHLTNVHRRTEEDDKGRLIRRYDKSGPDDYLHAEVYDLCATEVWRLLGGYQEAIEHEGEYVPDERLGFQRMPLDDPNADYDPGFNEG